MGLPTLTVRSSPGAGTLDTFTACGSSTRWAGAGAAIGTEASNRNNRDMISPVCAKYDQGDSFPSTV
jgi:hypothetical protein